MGTDSLGRDLFTQIVWGARISLMVGFLTVLIGGTVGVLLGVISAYVGGRTEAVIMRLADIQLAFPSFLLALAALAVLGPGLHNVILVLALAEWTQYARVARAQTLVILKQDFMVAARALGAGQVRQIVRHILPNIVSPLIVIASFSVARAIIGEASLSFLGIGVPPDIPTWGGVLARGRDYMRDASWLVTIPGLTLMVTVFGINIVGDWLRDVLDPHQRF